MTTQSTTTKEALEPCCDEWPAQSAIIDSYIKLQSARSGQDTFKFAGGVSFRFCPWCGKSRSGVSAPVVEVDGISWSALLAVLERLKSKTRNPDAEWYHGWNAAIQCLINDINGRRRTAPASTVAPCQSGHAFIPPAGAMCVRCGLSILAHQTAPASPAALQDEAKAKYDLDPLEFWCDLAEVLGHPRPTKADVPALVSEVKERLAARTPPSTRAKAAAEEIVAELDRRAWLFDSHGARPIASGKAAYMEQVVAAIIERCLAGGE